MSDAAPKADKPIRPPGRPDVMLNCAIAQRDEANNRVVELAGQVAELSGEVFDLKAQLELADGEIERLREKAGETPKAD